MPKVVRSEAQEEEVARIAMRLEHLRFTSRLSRQHLAAALGVNQCLIHRWERYQQAIPAQFIVPLCRALGCTPHTLLGYEEGA